MPHLDTISTIIMAQAAAGALIRSAVDLGRAHGDATGVWADSARDELAEAERHLDRLKADLAKLPTSERRAA